MGMPVVDRQWDLPMTTHSASAVVGSWLVVQFADRVPRLLPGRGRVQRAEVKA